MAGTDGRGGTSLKGLLTSEPYRFDVRQAVRMLEFAAHARAAEHRSEPPDCVPVGEGSDPRRESVRLRSSLSGRFPPSDIESLETAGPDGRPALTVAFLGIGGAFGPLPPPLTNRVLARERVRDRAGRDFLDIFNHRLVSLLLRQFRLFHPALQDPSRSDALARMPLLAALGLATLPRDDTSASIEGRLHGLSASLLGAAGLLNRRPVSAHALERLLATHFGLPVRVVTLRGGWLTLADDQLTRLGRAGRLGASAVLGRRVWDQAAGIRVEIGPLDRQAFMALLPGRAAYTQLAKLVEFALGDMFDVELHLSLQPRDVPPASLGAVGSRLGWTAWLGKQPRERPGTVLLHLAGGGATTADA